MTDDEVTEAEQIVVESSRLENLTDDQFLRLYIFDHYAENEGALIIKDMEAIFHWIMAGKVPRDPKDKSHLKEVT